MHEFREWPKTARLFRDIVVTEKLDGTNAAIHATPLAEWEAELIREYPDKNGHMVLVTVDGAPWAVSAQSRKRIITPGKSTDNFGFAAWVHANAAELVSLLGEGLHFGEWWGRGIQRGYDLTERRFSLFNTFKWGALMPQHVGEVLVSAVPVLYQGPNDTTAVKAMLRYLGDNGSVAAPGFRTPEGVCIWHSAQGNVTKVTLDANDAGKWELGA